MPTYEYQCTSCAHEFETFQRMSEASLTDCPACEEPALKRKIGLGAGFIFKGSGFYETDFKERKGFKEAEKASKSEAPKADAPAKETTAAKSAESKPAKKDSSGPAVSNAA